MSEGQNTNAQPSEQQSTDGGAQQEQQPPPPPPPPPGATPSVPATADSNSTHNQYSHLAGSPAAAAPLFATFDEMMKVVNGVGNMALAHEIAIDNNFKFEEAQLAENSVEAQVKKVMHRAFWDALQEKLDRTPPDFSHALILLEEVKEKLLEILLPQHGELATEIGAVLDLSLIEQQVQHGALDFMYYAHFITSVMARLCAPVRDDQIAALACLDQIVPLYREIFHILNMMRIDMANFHLEQIRPFIKQQAVSYEKTKFDELLNTFRANGDNGLKNTYAWLSHNHQQLAAAQLTAAQQQQQQGAGVVANPETLSPALILNQAYAHLLNWDKRLQFPETLLMDGERFARLHSETQWLCLAASVLLVTYNTVGDAISGIPGFQQKLKHLLQVIMPNDVDGEVGDQIINVAEQFNKEVNDCLLEHGFKPLDEKRQEMLKGQIRDVANTGLSAVHPVHHLMGQRVLAFLREVLAHPQQKQRHLPAGCACVADELAHVAAAFTQLVAHNRAVYGNYYSDIIGELLGARTGVPGAGVGAVSPGLPGPLASIRPALGPGVNRGPTKP